MEWEADKNRKTSLPGKQEIKGNTAYKAIK